MIRFLTASCALTLVLAMPSYSSDGKEKEDLYPVPSLPHKATQQILDAETPLENKQFQSVVDRVVQPVANALWRFQQLSTTGVPLDAEYSQVANAREESSSETAPSLRQDPINSLRVELLQSVSSELIGILRHELQIALSKEMGVHRAEGTLLPLLAAVQSSETLAKEKLDAPAMVEVKAENDTPNSYAALFGIEEASSRLDQIATNSKVEFIAADSTSVTAKETRKKFLQSTVHPEFRHLISPREFKELFGLDHPELEADFIKEFGSYEELLISGRFNGILDSSYSDTKKSLRALRVHCDRYDLKKDVDIKCSIVPKIFLRLDDELKYLVDDRMACSVYGTHSYMTYVNKFRRLSVVFTNKTLALPPHMASMSNLRNLCLARNRLNSLPLVIYKMTQLEKLDLSDNELTTISSDISDLSNLEELNLSNNILESIPASLSQCSKLIVYKLNLKGNPKLKEIWDRDVARFESIHGILSRRINDSKPPLPYEPEEPLAILLRSMPGFYQPDVNVII